MLPGAGVGSALLGAVEKVAADHGAKRVVVITSNDNLSALRFYQLRGYRMVAVLVGAIDAARESKPDDSCVLG
jgi:ribosomal protein S18 acetylase RimI-like enzyme